jgi:hypothetical protein
MLNKPLRLLVAATSIALVLVVAGVLPDTTAGAAPVAASSSCQRVIRITHLAFNPDSAPPGGSSSVYLSAVNCTDMAQQTSVTWLGKFTGGSGGSPVGCPEIDPYAQAADFSPHAAFRSKATYDVPYGCDARHLQITVRLSQGGTVLAHRSASLTILIPSNTY